MMNSDSESDMDANSAKSSYTSRSNASSRSSVSRPQTPQEHCRNLKKAMEGLQKAKNLVLHHEKMVSENHPAAITLFTQYLKEAVISRDQKGNGAIGLKFVLWVHLTEGDRCTIVDLMKFYMYRGERGKTAPAGRRHQSSGNFNEREHGSVVRTSQFPQVVATVLCLYMAKPVLETHILVPKPPPQFGKLRVVNEGGQHPTQIDTTHKTIRPVRPW
ncbi:hypothetical protein TNCT_256121 [Trichonephila clavata]|uniref:Uncharacterized protein n=1 Tax=Trichonephila clavata TaxID=2740835 RepID=A0A8X6IKZ0_TRICU|nr:hypothetical protein TNCT_256121 [Trichonephila clavata]